MNNAFTHTIHHSRISTSTGTKIEQENFAGPVSARMRIIPQRYGGLSTYFDVNDESENGINNTSFKQILNNNHTKTIKGLIRGPLPLDYIFGFCKSIRKKTKGLGFDLN